MCGIVGHWGYAGRSLAAPEFRKLTDSLSHRGPDGVGTVHFESKRLWLGQRRLAIIDVSTRGRQPMSYADGRYWIVYNGEIYNYLELRAPRERPRPHPQVRTRVGSAQPIEPKPEPQPRPQ